MTLEELKVEHKAAIVAREDKIKELGVLEGVLQTLEYVMSKYNVDTGTRSVVDAEVVK